MHPLWRKIRSCSGKYALILAIVSLGIVGIGLRTIHHGDWLIFQSYQSRDTLIVERALGDGGFTDLPLLGPQARGSDLHLGPVFYYFQYWSGKLFGPSPEAFAYPDLLFSILFLPLLYWLLCMFFDRGLSAWLTALASVSVFLVTFSRFAWNPNGLPFFTTLFLACFLEALQAGGRKRWTMIIGASISFGIIAQLHFVATIGLAIGIIIFTVRRRAFDWKEIALFMAIVLAIHTPMLLSEYRSGGANTRALFSSVRDKGSKDDGHNILEKTFRAYQEQSRIIWFMTVGQQNTDTILTRGFVIKCDQKCRAALPASVASMLLFGAILVFGRQTYRSETDEKKRTALTFVLIWFGSFFFVTILVAYQISTRFYLGIAPIIFILIGLAAQRLLAIEPKKIRGAITLAGVAFIALNLFMATNYLSELSMSRTSNAESGRDAVFGTDNKVTLGQLRALATETDRRFPIEQPLFISGESRYARSLYYLLSVEHQRKGCYVKGDSGNGIPRTFAHVAIDFTQATDNEKSSDPNEARFGTLTARFDDAVEPGENDTVQTSPSTCFTY